MKKQLRADSKWKLLAVNPGPAKPRARILNHWEGRAASWMGHVIIHFLSGSDFTFTPFVLAN